MDDSDDGEGEDVGLEDEGDEGDEEDEEADGEEEEEEDDDGDASDDDSDDSTGSDDGMREGSEATDEDGSTGQSVPRTVLETYFPDSRVKPEPDDRPAGASSRRAIPLFPVETVQRHLEQNGCGPPALNHRRSHIYRAYAHKGTRSASSQARPCTWRLFSKSKLPAVQSMNRRSRHGS